MLEFIMLSLFVMIFCPPLGFLMLVFGCIGGAVGDSQDKNNRLS